MQPARLSWPSRKAGLTLMEIVVAIGLVATISLLVIGTLSRLLATGGKTAHQTAGTLLAQEVIDTVAQAGPPFWSFGTTTSDDWKGSRELLLPGDQAKTSFSYKLEVLPLRNGPQDLGRLFQLKVTVWWWGAEPGGRAEQGKTFVTTTRTSYARN